MRAVFWVQAVANLALIVAGLWLLWPLINIDTLGNAIAADTPFYRIVLLDALKRLVIGTAAFSAGWIGLSLTLRRT